MGRVIAFSEFTSYMKDLSKGTSEFVRGTILDTNILISLTYEIKSDNDAVIDFVDGLEDHRIKLFTTVNTRSEYLDFNRRMTMTERLRGMLAEGSKWKISSVARAQIQSQSGQLTRTEQHGGDPVFSDRQLKKIKSAFSAGNHSGNAGWLKLCDAVLSGELDRAEEDLNIRGINYFSQHEPLQKDYFHTKIEWPEAKRLAEVTCLGLSDAMIINAFQCSRFPFMVSRDFDIGYAVLSSKELKDVVVPDSVAKKYRNYHFD